MHSIFRVFFVSVSSVLPFVFGLNEATGTCSSPYELVGSTCYYYEKEVKASLQGASELCRSHSNGALAKFGDFQEWSIAWEHLLSRQTRKTSESDYIWTGEQRNLSSEWQNKALEMNSEFHIGPTSPVVSSRPDAVLVLDKSRFFFLSSIVSTSENQFNFLCQKPAATTSSRCPKPYEFVDNSCYYIDYSHHTTWSEAWRKCQEQSNGHLLRIESAREWATIKSKLLQKHYDNRGCDKVFDYYLWTGGVSVDRLEEKAWVWAGTGDAVTHFDWAPGQPQMDQRSLSAIVIDMCDPKFPWAAASLLPPGPTNSPIPIESRSPKPLEKPDGVPRNFICETEAPKQSVVPVTMFVDTPDEDDAVLYYKRKLNLLPLEGIVLQDGDVIKTQWQQLVPDLEDLNMALELWDKDRFLPAKIGYENKQIHVVQKNEENNWVRFVGVQWPFTKPTEFEIQVVCSDSSGFTWTVTNDSSVEIWTAKVEHITGQSCQDVTDIEVYSTIKGRVLMRQIELLRQV